jgi:hypothetical protein
MAHGNLPIAFARSDSCDKASPRCLRDRLEILSDGQNVKSFAFQPAFDQRHGPGATIRNMLDFLFAELGRADSLLANEIARRTFEDNLALCLLLGLPHSHTQRLQRSRGAAAPGNVRRAEEFMRANADTPLTIADIAQAAGCSVRALQMAFDRFRGTTPMAALRRIRLEQSLHALRVPPVMYGVLRQYGHSPHRRRCRVPHSSALNHGST